MIGGPRLLISVPAGELARHVPDGSLLGLRDLRASPVSADLTDALQLIEAACEPVGTEITVVVRPEMFTHGPSLEWLRERTGGAQHHLCFSDGEAVRVIPGLDNHVFFYNAGSARSAAALLVLRRRAPELLGLIRSQVNAAYVLQEGRTGTRPPTKLLPRADLHEDEEDGAGARLLPFFTSRGPVLRDATAMAQQDDIAPEHIGRFDSLTYVALNGTALGTVAFVNGLANLLVSAYLAAGNGLVLQVPSCETTPVQIEDGIAFLLDALRRYAPNLPSGMPSNIFLHAGGHGPLPAHLFAGPSRMVAHESAAFWRLPPSFYGPFGEATLLRDRVSIQHKAGFRKMVRGLTGRVWAEAVLPEAENQSLARFRW